MVSDKPAGLPRCYGVGVAIEPETANVVCDAKSAELALRELRDDAQTLPSTMI